MRRRFRGQRIGPPFVEPVPESPSFDVKIATHLFGLEAEAIQMLVLSVEMREKAERILGGIDALVFAPPPIVDPPCREDQ